ncbi:hypothetical protein A3J91_02395 [Candidatus Peribacteria bacterium RIFOXYC2_FULL_58_10]|nr:MAG: hypothetical protein A3J91_02395 [Candidatus Peribacteria bacterium RIFOXYC2_FULL_58_10]OGJ83753.1 MAG: hypothetical protein A2529_05370 [Candidatus Peribacteria bacterium RIFOXYD2_FULL_58_15]
MPKTRNPYLAIFTGTLCLMGMVVLGLQMQEWRLPWIERAIGATCGNGEIETGEGCDDENTDNGDGCSAACAVEGGYTCTESCPSTGFADTITNYPRLLWLDATHVLAVYEEVSTHTLKAVVGTVSGDSITFATANTIGSAADGMPGLQAVKVDTNTVVIFYAASAGTPMEMRTLTITGNTVTASDAASLSVDFPFTELALEALSTTKVVGLYTAGVGPLLYSVIGDIQPDKSIVFGTPVQVNGTGYTHADLAVISLMKFVVIGNAENQYIWAETGNVSGNLITYGTQVSLSSGISATDVSVAFENGYIAFVYYLIETYARIATVSGTDIVLNDATAVTAASNASGMHIRAISGNATYKYVLSWYDAVTYSAHSALCTRALGDTTLDCDTTGSDVTYSVADSVEVGIAEPDVYSTNDFIFAYSASAGGCTVALGNADPIHYCRSTCRLNTCGDGYMDAGEDCDDGNLVAGDGCDGTCSIESGYSCVNNCPAASVAITYDSNAEPELVWLDTTRVLAVFHHETTGDVTAKVGTVSGHSITFAAETTIATNASPSQGLQAIKVDTDKVVIAYSATDGVVRAWLRVLTISGDTITAAAATAVGPTASNIALEALSTSKVVFLYANANPTAYAIIGEIQPDNSITVGGGTGIDGTQHTKADIAVLSSTQFAVFYYRGDTTTVAAQTGNVSGTSITFGTAVTVLSDYAPQWVSVAVESGKIAFIYSYTNVSIYYYSRIGTVSGTDITLNAAQPLTAPSEAATAHIRAISGDATYQYVMAWYETSDLTSHSILCYRTVGDTVLSCITGSTNIAYSLSTSVYSITEPDVSSGNEIILGYQASGNEWSAVHGDVDPVYYCGSECTSGQVCGNGAIEGSEACDDGDTDAGDGCSATCTVESGYACIGEPSVCTLMCGDGDVDAGETCDDGNVSAGDGCSAACAVETGYSCAGEPSVCTVTCGDGVITGSEACDDDNVTAGDGCSATCTLESGFTCTGTPSSCVTRCGDSIVAGTEECDPPGTATCTELCLYRTAGGGGGTAGATGDTAAPKQDAGSAAAGPGAAAKPVILCGNGILDPLEECDEGNLNELLPCSSKCKKLFCGDGEISYKIGEECEPESYMEYGRTMYRPLPSCSEDPQATYCAPPGSTYKECVLTPLPACKVEGEEKGMEIPFASLSEQAFCGNGRKDEAEQCDFGGLCVGGRYDGALWRDRSAALLCRGQGGMTVSRSGDGCAAQCRFEFCGDGFLLSDEQCDNGSVCANDRSRACRTSADCDGESCLFNAEVNPACTKSCALCAGRYGATVDVASLTEGDHTLKVKVTNPCGVSTLAEAHFSLVIGISAISREGDPVPGLASRPSKEPSSSADGTRPFKVSMTVDKKKYAQGMDTRAQVTLIVTDADGYYVPGLTSDSFVLALDGRKAEGVRVAETQSIDCVSSASSVRLQRQYLCSSPTP